MYNSYSELLMLKDLFTKKPSAEKLYECVTATKSGSLLRMFDIKLLDKLTPKMIMQIMADYKSDVIEAYNHKTKNRILQSILDYCSCGEKPEQTIKVSPKELDWLYCAKEYNVCSPADLMKGRFELSKPAKDLILTKGTFNNIAQFKEYFNDKDLAKAFERNVSVIKFIKKPTQDQLRKYWNEYKYNRDMPVVSNYPLDLLIDMCEHRSLSIQILEKNEKYNGLLTVFEKLYSNSDWNNDYGIDKSNNEELINYAQLVNNDKDLLKEYVKERLLAMGNKA